jgi:hypothetical protein
MVDGSGVGDGSGACFGIFSAMTGAVQEIVDTSLSESTVRSTVQGKEKIRDA